MPLLIHLTLSVWTPKEGVLLLYRQVRQSDDTVEDIHTQQPVTDSNLGAEWGLFSFILKNQTLSVGDYLKLVDIGDCKFDLGCR